MDVITDRSIRVFISSTFRDMQGERNYLVKFIFPQLRKICEQRGVAWSEVDLRWGITDEQSAEEQVLPICLEEIKRCRPYFIGILGERYGWIPEKVNSELIEREPWLAEHLDHSVTELEILHGVLNNPEMADRALFYFRDPAYVQDLPTERQEGFLEDLAVHEMEEYGREEAQKRALDRKTKLTALKERIRKSGLSLKEGFQDPQQLGIWVLEDMTAIIDRIYPEGSQPTPLKLEGQEHEAFAVNRAKVYIGGEKYFKKIDEHVAGVNLPLVVLGESGFGKSALLANWGLKHRMAHPDKLVLMHFIGASAASGDWSAMLRRILSELQERFNIQGEIPTDVTELRETLPDWLHIAAQKGRVLLILDALNQLEDKQGAQELTWLPMEFPENVQVILSTLPGKTLDSLNKREYPVLFIEPLTRQEREKFVSVFLAQYSKQLNSQQVGKIVEDPKLSNPLGLRILLDELRQFGIHERLNEIIQHYLNANSVNEMLELVFERCEKDFETERPGLVRDTLCNIWAARQGLSEGELLNLLGNDGQPLAQRVWSPLHLALEESLLEHSGLLNFSHAYIRQAVEKHYLATESEQIAVSTRLADYFQSIAGYPRRKVNELPWQLQRIKDWKRLYDVLAAPAFFMAQWCVNRNDLYPYWTTLEENSSFNRVQAYKDSSNDPKIPDYQSFLNRVSLFFMDTGYLEAAMDLLKELEKISRERGNKEDVQISLGNQALILKTWGRLDEAMDLFKEQERIYREMGDMHGLQLTLGNQALILHARGRFDEAMQMQKETERICRRLGNKDGIQTSLSNQAMILKEWGRLEEAMELLKEQELICRELGIEKAIQVSLGNQALILQMWGKLDESMELHKKEEQICRKLGSKDGLQRSLGNQALILQMRGKLEDAMGLFKEQERICRDMGAKRDLQSALGNQALILRSWGRLDEAMQLLKEQENAYRELGDQDGLQRSLGNQALILRSWGKVDEAMQLQKEKERICRELGNQDGIQNSLGNQALILKALGKFDEAMALFKEQERICRELNNKEALQESIGCQAQIYHAQGRSQEAMQMQKEKERICRELGNLNGIQETLGDQALILQKWGKLDEAMDLLKEKERICQQLKNVYGLCLSWVYQGTTCLIKGDKATGIGLLQKAYDLARQNGYQSLVIKTKGLLDRFS